MARAFWTLGFAAYLAHVLCAFAFVHHWSHAEAATHTGYRTGEMTGWFWTGGIWLNYLFTLLWAGDVIYWWSGLDRYARRPERYRWFVHALFAFMIFQAGVVFAAGLTRWLTLAGLSLVAAAGLLEAPPSAADSHAMTPALPKVAYLTAGGGGMFCGSCMRDNTLAAALTRLGCDVALVPLYTPIRTDETDVSIDQVFFGGINVYLQQKIPLFRYLPGFVDRWLDSPWILKRIAAGRIKVAAEELGDLTVQMLKGEHGHLRRRSSGWSTSSSGTCSPRWSI